MAPCGWGHAYLADTGHPGHSGHLALVKEGCGLLACPLREEVVDFVIVTHRAVFAFLDQHRGHKLSIWGMQSKRQRSATHHVMGDSLPASVCSHGKPQRTPGPPSTLPEVIHSIPRPMTLVLGGEWRCLTVQPVQR